MIRVLLKHPHGRGRRCFEFCFGSRGYFRADSLDEALKIGLVSGDRNVTLKWAAEEPALAQQPEIELFVPISVLPIFMMPLLTRRVIGLLRQNKVAADC